MRGLPAGWDESTASFSFFPSRSPVQPSLFPLKLYKHLHVQTHLFLFNPRLIRLKNYEFIKWGIGNDEENAVVPHGWFCTLFLSLSLLCQELKNFK